MMKRAGNNSLAQNGAPIRLQSVDRIRTLNDLSSALVLSFDDLLVSYL